MLRLVGRILVFGWLILGSLQVSNLAVASEPTAQSSTLAVTPRIWYSVSGQAFYSDNILFQSSTENVTLPLFGGSVSYSPPNANGISFSVTGFYGEGDGRFTGLGLQTLPGLGLSAVSFVGTTDVSRLDVEAVAQIPVAGSRGVNFVVGGRYVDVDVNISGTQTVLGVGTTSSFRFTGGSKLYLGEAGIGLATAVSSDGAHSVFGNLVFLAGYARETNNVLGTTTITSGAVVGLDTNVGYGIQAGSNAIVSARYRLFALSGVDFNFNDETTFVHGPELNLSIRF